MSDLVKAHIGFLLFAAAIGLWLFLSERARKKKLSASDRYIAEMRRAREERARREATKFLGARRG